MVAENLPNDVLREAICKYLVAHERELLVLQNGLRTTIFLTLKIYIKRQLIAPFLMQLRTKSAGVLAPGCTLLCIISSKMTVKDAASLPTRKNRLIFLSRTLHLRLTRCMPSRNLPGHRLYKRRQGTYHDNSLATGLFICRDCTRIKHETGVR